MDQYEREHHFLRHLNLTLVAGALREHQPISRADLAERVRLGRSTITGIVGQLIRSGFAVEVGEAESSGGRKPILLEVAPGLALVACVRITNRTVALGLADLNGNLVARHRRALRGSRSPADVLEQVGTWVTEMIREFRLGKGKVIGAGVSLPGRLGNDRGLVLHSRSLGWGEVPFQSELEIKLGLPVLLVNEAGAFTVGEQSLSRADDFLGMMVGSSVDGALVLGGELCAGSIGGVGAVGHLTIDPDGPLCYCGRRGCLESLVSDDALVAQALAAIDRGADSLLLELVEGRRQAITREVIVAAAQDGDRLSLRLLEQAGQRIGQGAAQFANLVGPQGAVFGGDTVDQAGPLIFQAIRETLLSHLVPWVRERVRVHAAVSGEQAMLTGAAHLVLKRVFRLPVPGEQAVDPFNICNWLPEES